MEKHHHSHHGHHHPHGHGASDQVSRLLQLMNECDRFLTHRIGGTRGKETVLRLLAAQPDISQKELQTQMGIQAGSISELLSKLEHQELITRHKDDTDKRMIRICLTEKGIAEAALLEARSQEDPFSVLEQEEQEALQALLEKLLERWTERYAKPHHHRHGGHRKKEADQ